MFNVHPPFFLFRAFLAHLTCFTCFCPAHAHHPPIFLGGRALGEAPSSPLPRTCFTVGITAAHPPNGPCDRKRRRKTDQGFLAVCCIFYSRAFFVAKMGGKKARVLPSSFPPAERKISLIPAAEKTQLLTWTNPTPGFLLSPKVIKVSELLVLVQLYLYVCFCCCPPPNFALLFPPAKQVRIWISIAERIRDSLSNICIFPEMYFDFVTALSIEIIS